MSVVLYLWLGFKLWMLVDAIKRRVEFGWYLLLALPFGAVVYFFAVKARAFNVRQAPPPKAVEPEADLAGLQAAAEHSPSFRNRVDYAFALLYADRPGDALPWFEAALSTHSKEKEALMGVGMAHLALGQAERAVEPLATVVDRSFAYRDYAAALALVHGLEETGQASEAVQLAERIVRQSERYPHRLALAELQGRLGRTAEAKDTLRQLLSDFGLEPPYVRAREQALDRRAKQLLQELT